jgi:anthranilate phosphoribosyltransferase
VLVVHADDGLDEISIGGSTQIAELKQGEVSTYRVSPEQFGMAVGDVDDLAVADAAASLAMINAVFAGADGAARDIVLLNAGAAIYVSGLAISLENGIELARKTVASGAAKQKFEQLIETSSHC